MPEPHSGFVSATSSRFASSARSHSVGREDQEMSMRTQGQGQRQQRRAMEGLLCREGRVDGGARIKHTHRSRAGSDYPSCGPNGDNRDAVQEAWSTSATMVFQRAR